jgi:nucleoside-diphosphate-sugar epimerase
MILVTGGAGLIGRELVRRLLQKGLQVRVLSRKQANTPGELWIGDITNPKAVEAAMSGVEVVYHLAALVDHFASPAELYQTNVRGTVHVVRAALKKGIRRLVHCSTVSAEKGGGTTAYGQSKIKAEAELRSLGNRLPWIIIRPGPVYDSERSNLQQAVRLARKFRIFGRLAPDTIIHLASRTNVVNALLLAADSGRAGQAYTVCDLWPVPRSLLSKIICERTGAVSIPIPLAVMQPLLYALAGVLESVSKARNSRPPMDRNYLRVLTRRREYDISAAVGDLGYDPAPTEIHFAQAVASCLNAGV